MKELPDVPVTLTYREAVVLLDAVSALRIDHYDKRPEMLAAGAKIAHVLAQVTPPYEEKKA